MMMSARIAWFTRGLILLLTIAAVIADVRSDSLPAPSGSTFLVYDLARTLAICCVLMGPVWFFTLQSPRSKERVQREAHRRRGRLARRLKGFEAPPPDDLEDRERRKARRLRRFED